MNKRILAVIPARYGSTRLEAKMLCDISGKSLLQWVWEGASRSKNISRLVIATDSSEIKNCADDFGAEVVMTSKDIGSGSERVAKAAELLSGSWDVVINVQGDMPFIRGAVIDRALEFFADEGKNFDVATIAVPVEDEEVFRNPSDVKVVIAKNQQALYFSRAAIPHSRDGGRIQGGYLSYKHVGLYLFKPEVLNAFVKLEPSELEKLEKLEQLRLMENAYSIGVCVVDKDLAGESIEIDTLEDLEKARKLK